MFWNCTSATPSRYHGYVMVINPGRSFDILYSSSRSRVSWKKYITFHHWGIVPDSDGRVALLTLTWRSLVLNICQLRDCRKEYRRPGIEYIFRIVPIVMRSTGWTSVCLYQYSCLWLSTWKYAQPGSHDINSAAWTYIQIAVGLAMIFSPTATGRVCKWPKCYDLLLRDI